MTRIISGTAGGRRIQVPPRGTRPTSDRVREALFTRLDSYDLLADARVLDLYAGSGALGLEAASRGARSVDLVEADRRAAQVCRDNADTLAAALPDTAVRVHQATVESYLAGRARGPGAGGGAAGEHGGPSGHGWDLVLIDPPYDVATPGVDAVLAHLVGELEPGAVVVVERSSRSEQLTLPDGLAMWDERAYGETKLFFIDRE